MRSHPRAATRSGGRSGRASRSITASAGGGALNLGGAFDHFGYYWNSGFGATVRSQLGRLRTFLAGLPLRQLVTSPIP